MIYFVEIAMQTFQFMLYYIYRITHIRNYKMKRNDCKMKLSEMSTEKIYGIKYIVYKRMYDFENGTEYMKQHNAMKKTNKTKYACVPQYVENVHNNVIHDTQTEIATTTHEIESSSFERITTNNGTQRTIIGNFNDNRVMIKKTLNHLNAMKRAMSISNTTNDENTRLRNENIMYRELLNIELSIRTINKNINENK